jgi:hypothetical protein
MQNNDNDDGILVGTRNDRNYNNETEERTVTHSVATYQTNTGEVVAVQTDLRSGEHITISLDTGDDVDGSPYLDATITDALVPGVRVPMFMRMLQEVFLVESVYWFVCWLSCVVIVLMIGDNVGIAAWSASLTVTLIVGFVTVALYVLLVAKIGERLQGARSDVGGGGPGATQWYNTTTITYLYPMLGCMYVAICASCVITAKSGFIASITQIVFLVSLCVLIVVTKWNTDITGGMLSGTTAIVSCISFVLLVLLTFDVFTSTVAVVVASQINAARLLWIFFYARKHDKYTADEGRRAHLDLYTEALYNAIVACYHQRPGDMAVAADEEEDVQTQ